MELHRQRSLHPLGEVVFQKSQTVPRTMDEPPWPFEDTLRMDCNIGFNTADLHQVKRQEVVLGDEGTGQHPHIAHGQE